MPDEPQAMKDAPQKTANYAHKENQSHLPTGDSASGATIQPPGVAQFHGLNRTANGSNRVAQLQQYQQLANQGKSDVLQNSATVQRKVTMNGTPISSIVNYLNQVKYLGTDGWDEMLDLNEAEASGWMLGLNKTWNFTDPGDLMLFVNKVASTTKLLRGIFGLGILSKTKLIEKGISFTGSEDLGNDGQLAVNILDHRTKESTDKQITEESLYSQDRGSISVALERQNDWMKEDLLKGEDVTLDAEKEKELRASNIEFGDLLVKHEKIKEAFKRNKGYLNGMANSEMQDRAQSTIMAIAPLPTDSGHKLTKDFTSSSARSSSYESSVNSGQIKPGQGGFTTLLIPQWYQPFYLMLKDHAPKDVEVKFVGSKTITANYKYGGDHIPVTVQAPDYESEITPMLKKFELLATHILTI